MDFVAGFQLGATRGAMHLLAEPVAHNPDAAGRRAVFIALVPAVVEEAVFARGFIVDDVRVLARDGAIDLGVFGEGEIVTANEAGGTVDIHGAADVGARFGKRDLRRVGLAGDND